MKIHIVTNLFSPDELAGASLYTDLAVYLKKAGHDVRVTGTFSYYPAWKVRDEDKGIPFRDDNFDGIPVRRVKMYVPENPSGAKRMLSDLSFLWALLRHGSTKLWTPDVVITAEPMLSQVLAQRFMYRGLKVPRLIIVQDFVVDAALELNILNLPGLASLLRGVERWGLRSAKTITTISPTMLEKLRSCVGENGPSLKFIPNWIHGSLEEGIESQMKNEPCERFSDRLLYSGNLGVKQGLPDFVKIFRTIDTSWKLRIQGGGAEREKLASETADCETIELGDVSDEASYIRSLREAGACLITQKAGVSANFLPSKLLPALATGTPVLAVCDEASPLGQEVLDAQCGAVIPPDDADALSAKLEEWAADPGLMKSFSENALARADKFRQRTILPQLEDEMKAIASAPEMNRWGAPSTANA